MPRQLASHGLATHDLTDHQLSAIDAMVLDIAQRLFIALCMDSRRTI